MQKCIYLHSRTKTFYQESCLHTTSFFAGFSSLYIAWTQSGTAEHAAQIKKEQNSADSWRAAGGGGEQVFEILPWKHDTAERFDLCCVLRISQIQTLFW